MVDTRHLRNKTVILMFPAISRAVSTCVVNEENDGLWFSDGGLIGALVDAGIPAGIKAPAIFVPFCQIQPQGSPRSGQRGSLEIRPTKPTGRGHQTRCGNDMAARTPDLHAQLRTLHYP